MLGIHATDKHRCVAKVVTYFGGSGGILFSKNPVIDPSFWVLSGTINKIVWQLFESHWKKLNKGLLKFFTNKKLFWVQNHRVVDSKINLSCEEYKLENDSNRNIDHYCVGMWSHFERKRIWDLQTIGCWWKLSPLSGRLFECPGSWWGTVNKIKREI